MISHQINIKHHHDFVKAIHYDASNIVCLFEKFHLQLYSCDLSTQQGQFWFQTPIYDGRKITDDILMVSCCKMPLRLYQISTGECIGCLADKKQNSQIYLSPLQLSIKTNHEIVGAGCRFVSLYYPQLMETSRIKSMDKVNASAVCCCDSELIVGSFEGDIHIIDNLSHKVTFRYRPHVDGVTSIVPYQQNYFISGARKDNYRYLWDRRNLNTFVECYGDELYGNQRISMSVKGDQLYTGSQTGHINQYQIGSGQLVNKHQIANQIISSVETVDGKIVYGTGSRKYTQAQFQHVIGFVNFDHEII